MRFYVSDEIEWSKLRKVDAPSTGDAILDFMEKFNYVREGESSHSTDYSLNVCCGEKDEIYKVTVTTKTSVQVSWSRKGG